MRTGKLNNKVNLAKDTDNSALARIPEAPNAQMFVADEVEAPMRAMNTLESALEVCTDEGVDILLASESKRGQRAVRQSASACIKLQIYEATRDDCARQAKLSRRRRAQAWGQTKP